MLNQEDLTQLTKKFHELLSSFVILNKHLILELVNSYELLKWNDANEILPDCKDRISSDFVYILSNHFTPPKNGFPKPVMTSYSMGKWDGFEGLENPVSYWQYLPKLNAPIDEEVVKKLIEKEFYFMEGSWDYEDFESRLIQFLKIYESLRWKSSKKELPKPYNSRANYSFPVLVAFEWNKVYESSLNREPDYIIDDYNKKTNKFSGCSDNRYDVTFWQELPSVLPEGF